MAVVASKVGDEGAAQFPAESRTSGMAMGHAIGVTLAFTLLIAATGDKLFPSLFVAFAAAISLASAMAIHRRRGAPESEA